MAINKPYKRIHRKMLHVPNEAYLLDPLYAPDMLSFIHSYHLIEKDLKVLFDYISPNTPNNPTFSHRIYELFFRCCTEFENNAKAVLLDNGYVPAANMNIANDYFKINKALKLNEYEVSLNIWENGPLILRPFANWNTAVFSPLTWYQDYNAVKHNRSANFHLANFENLIIAAAGLFIILFAQYGYHAFSPYQPVELINDTYDYHSANDSLFGIKPYEWPNADKYDFNWEALKLTANPFDNYVF